MTAMGTPTSVATTQMRAMLVELAKDGSKVNDSFTEIAGVGFREFIDGGGDLAGAIAIIEQAADDNGVALSDMFGSVEAGAAALALGGDNAEKFQDTLAEMGASAGATEGAFDTMDKGLSRSFDKIKASITVALINVGEKLAPFVEKFAAVFQDKLPAFLASAEELFGNLADAISAFIDGALTSLADWWDVNGPKVLAVVETIRAGIETAFNFIVGKVKWVIENWDKLQGPLKIMAGLIAAVMIPHWVALGIAAVISAGQQVAAWVATKIAAFKSITAASVAIVKFIAKWVLLGLQSLLAGAKVAAAWLLALGPIGLLIAAVALAVGLIIANWDTIKKAALAVKDWIVAKFTTVIDFLKKMPGRVASALSGVWNGIKEAALTAKNWIVDKFDAVVSFITRLPRRIGRAARGMWDGIKDAFKAALNWVIKKWNSLSFRMPSIRAFGRTIGGFTLGTPNIPLFHQGGVFRAPRPGGEGLAILRDRETVLQPGERQGPLIGVVNLLSAADPDEIARAIAWRLRTAGV